MRSRDTASLVRPLTLQWAIVLIGLPGSSSFQMIPGEFFNLLFRFFDLYDLLVKLVLSPQVPATTLSRRPRKAPSSWPCPILLRVWTYHLVGSFHTSKKRHPNCSSQVSLHQPIYASRYKRHSSLCWWRQQSVPWLTVDLKRYVKE